VPALRRVASRLMTDPRAYPLHPYLAVSAAIIHDGKVLAVRRARKPAIELYTLPGGGVETGETLVEAVRREVQEETGLDVEPVALAGHREAIIPDAQGVVKHHFVILCFASRLIGGEIRLNDELDDARWLKLAELSALKTTDGLGEIVEAAFNLIEPGL